MGELRQITRSRAKSRSKRFKDQIEIGIRATDVTVKRVPIMTIGITIVIVAIVVGFAYQTIPPSCVNRSFITTSTYVSNGSMLTTTATNYVICDPFPVFSLFAYPLEFFIAILVGIGVAAFGAIKKP